MMDPKLQFVFFMLAAACWFMAAFKENYPPMMNHKRYMAIGWILAIVPFAVNAAYAGW